MALPGIPCERRLLVMADPRDKALQDYRKKLLEHKEIDGRLKECERGHGGRGGDGGWALLGAPRGSAAAAALPALRHGPGRAPGAALDGAGAAGVPWGGSAGSHNHGIV